MTLALIRWRSITLALLAVLAITGSLTLKHGLRTPALPDWNQSYAKLPMSFEANLGQSNSSVQFISRGNGYRLFLTADEAVLVLSKAKAPSTAIRMRLEGANERPIVSGEDELPGKVNYLIGSDPGKWRTDVPTYSKVRYRDRYPGIDVVYYGNGQQLEFDFVVTPGAQPGVIRMGFEGTRQPSVDADGELVLQAKTGEEVLRLGKPVVYQFVNEERRDVRTEYVLFEDGDVGFQVGDYDVRETLVIDPTVSYLALFGGFGNDFVAGIALDGAANAYVTGYTDSLNFPAVNAIQPTKSSNYDSFVAKLNAAGTALIYSTYLGGSDFENANGIAVDDSGNAYVTGLTASTDFPLANALQPLKAGSADVFVARLNAAGNTLGYSTYIGGSSFERGGGIAVDGAGNAYVTGSTNSANFPTVNPIQANYGSGQDAFLAKLNAAGTALVYSTFLGGGLAEESTGIAIDDDGNAYVTGSTTSPNFPNTNPLQSSHGGGSPVLPQDAFVTKVNATASAFVYSTYLGGSGDDVPTGIRVDPEGNAHLTGRTKSANFPTANALQPGHAGGVWDSFVSKLNPAGSALVYSTYLGGGSDDQASAIDVDSAGNAHVTGLTSSPNFPLANPSQPFYGGGTMGAFVSKLNPAGSALVYSTYLGAFYTQGVGIAADGSSNVYVTGTSLGRVFYTPFLELAPAINTTVFIQKISFVNVTPVASRIAPLSGSPGSTVSAVIIGNGLSEVSTVTFSGSGVTATIGNGRTDTSLPITISIASGAELTMRNVTLTAPGGTSTPLPGFTVTPPSLWNWNFAGTPLWTSNVNGIYIHPQNDALWYVTTDVGLFVTWDAGNSWQHPLAGVYVSSDGFAIQASDTNRVYAGMGANLYKSTDRGLSWTQLPSFLPPGRAVGSLAVDETDGRIYIPSDADPGGNAFNPGVFVSNNSGSTWNFYSFGITEDHLIFWDIEQDLVTGVLYVVSEIADHPAPYDPPVFRSLDKGVTWQEISGSTLAWHGIKIQTDPVNDDVYILLEGPGLYRSSNNGLSWQFLSFGVTLALVVDPAHHGRIYGGSHINMVFQGGAFLSTDSGLNFQPIGLSNLQVNHLALNASGTRLFAVVHGFGIFHTSVAGLPPRRRSNQITSQ
jgi:hypothetical protein